MPPPRTGATSNSKYGYQITWRRTENRIAETMEDDSLIHLFTEKKRIKKRTQLLNAHIRFQPKQAISYPDYIRAKTAILRNCSDQETTDDSDWDFEGVATVKKPQKSALHTLLNDMLLNSSISSDESGIQSPQKMAKTVRESFKKSEKLSEKSVTKPVKRPSEKTTSVDLNPPKRPRGRPRKTPVVLQPIETSTTNCTNNEESTKALKRQCITRKKSKSRVKSGDVLSDDTVNPKIVTVIVENRPQSAADFNINPEESNDVKIEQDPLAPDVHIKQLQTPTKDYSTDSEIPEADQIAQQIFNEKNNEISNSKTPNTSFPSGNEITEDRHLSELNYEKIAAEEPFTLEKSEEDSIKFENWLEGGSEDEFFSPDTTDADNNDENDVCKEALNDQENDINSKELTEMHASNSMDVCDDLFEEEKMITLSDYGITGLSQFRSDFINQNQESQVNSDDDFKEEIKCSIQNSISKESCRKKDAENKKNQSEFLENQESADIEKLSQLEVSHEKKRNSSQNSGRKSNHTECNTTRLINFTQDFDEKNEETENIEKYMNNTVKNMKEKTKNRNTSESHLSPKSSQLDKKIKVDKSKALVSTKMQEKSSKKKKNKESSVSKAMSSDEVQKSHSSNPKTPADVKKNLLATLNTVTCEKLRPLVLDSPSSKTATKNSKSGDLPSSSPADSGFDEESGTLRTVNDKTLKGADKPKEIELDQITSSTKKTNLKITCTEVFTSKYTIIRNNKDNKVDAKSTITQIGSSRIDGKKSPRTNHESYSEGDSEMEFFKTDVVTFKNQLDACNSDDPDSEYSSRKKSTSEYTTHDGRKKKRPPKTSILEPSESDSLKYVLDTLATREKNENHGCVEAMQVLQQDLSNASNVDSESEAICDEPFQRPTTIPEFIEGKDVQLFDGIPAYTLTDITKDDDFYLLEIPKSFFQKDLKGEKFRLKKKTMIIGQDRYDIQTKDGKPMSWVLPCGDNRHRYKTGIINPLKQVVLRQQVKDDFLKSPKTEYIGKCVPFPKNVKTRNPLVMDRENLSLSRSMIDEEHSDNISPSQKTCFNDEKSGDKENKEIEDRPEEFFECSKNLQKPLKLEQLDENTEISNNEEKKLTNFTLGIEKSAEDECDIHSSDTFTAFNKKERKSRKNHKKLFREQDSTMSIYQDFDIDLKDEKISQIVDEDFTDDQTHLKMSKKKKGRKTLKHLTITEDIFDRLDVDNKTVLPSPDEDGRPAEKHGKLKKKRNTSDIEETPSVMPSSSNSNKSVTLLDFKGKKRRERFSPSVSTTSSSDEEVIEFETNQIDQMEIEEEKMTENIEKLKKKTFLEQLMDDDED